ncbi:MFS general substrate transporter [Laetiporus sulphureus 93-53]|uniref:MFS general substrate transporter n=1 Tax=Laetiporus sulphureus 93-53 TaxID=1314785 RepID=A0A165GDK0_9APHY|nr:MFS general substrate transporter [Laetiporus sulphureus 93-53]KZT10198.1 MFS general substrate transporter [Laetiporus sulphureus 93-53]
MPAEMTVQESHGMEPASTMSEVLEDLEDRYRACSTIHGSAENLGSGNAGVSKLKAEEGFEPEEISGEPSPITYPDGGTRAWLVALGVGCGIMATFGYVNAWGVFQAYYEETMLPDTPPSTIAWIGSVQYALVFIPGLVFGRLFDMGYFKLPLLGASSLLVTATFLVAECTQFWQLILCQGIAVGLACGAIFGPTLGILPHWFHKKLGVAYGLTATGSSLGGTIFPIAVRNLIDEVGFKWTMRIVGFILVLLLGICNLTTERRLPPKPNQGPFINPRAFKNPAYSFYTAASFASFLGLYTVLTYIDVSASDSGIPTSFSFYLLPIANVGSLFGRIVGGFMADRWGPLNVITPATCVAGIMTYAWPFSGSIAGYVVIAILYGMSSGIYASLLAPPIVSMGERWDVGTRIGMSFTVLALGALAGPPISGAIYTATGSYKAVGYYAGSAVEVAVVLLIISRYFVLGHKLVGKC